MSNRYLAALCTVAACASTLSAGAQEAWKEPWPARDRTVALMAANTLAVALYGRQNWWQDGFRSRFRTANEGWFGQQTYSGGADKLGHFYLNYASTRLFARAFEWSGNDPDDALKLAALLMAGTFTAVEVADGFSERWRFSKEDLVMNLAGVGAAMLLERHPRLDRAIDLRFHYRRSREPGQGFDPFGDYSGQTYLLVLKGDGFPAWHAHPWLRYVEVAVGYGTRGYPAGSGSDPARKVYVGLSLNLSEVLNRIMFKNTPRRATARRVSETVLEYVQVPGTAVFHTRRLDR